MRNNRLNRLKKLTKTPITAPTLASKLYRIARSTSRHVGAIPEGCPEPELRTRAQAWAADLVSIFGITIDLHQESEVPDGPKLVVLNHRSYTDIIVLNSLIPCRFLAKEEVKGWPVIGKAAQSVHTLFVQRDAQTSRLLSREAIERGLREGATLSIFPEGTTTPSPGCKPFFRGSFEVAAKVGAPVIPVAIEYDADDIWLNESFIEHFARTFHRREVGVHVGIGAPIYPTPLEDPDHKESVVAEGERLRTEAHQWIHKHLMLHYRP